MATASRSKTKVSKREKTKIEGIARPILNSSKKEEALIRAQIALLENKRRVPFGKCSWCIFFRRRM